MNNGLASQVIIDILINEMGMDANHVILRDQNFLIPSNDELYIVVGLVNSMTMANHTHMEEKSVTVSSVTTKEQVEVNQVNTQENIQIDVLSSGITAAQRNWEVLAALKSIYSQQKQESENFRLLQLPRSFINTSSAEGGSQINRYSITVPAFVWYRKEKVLSADGSNYFDTFPTRVDDYKTIGSDVGLIQFTLPDDITGYLRTEDGNFIVTESGNYITVQA